MEDPRSTPEAPDDDTPPAPDDALTRLADAPIELHVELARVTLPLETLASLRVGQVLETGRAIGERVRLCAGSQVVAEGELVRVDGEIGVRLTRVGR